MLITPPTARLLEHTVSHISFDLLQLLHTFQCLFLVSDFTLLTNPTPRTLEHPHPRSILAPLAKPALLIPHLPLRDETSHTAQNSSFRVGHQCQHSAVEAPHAGDPVRTSVRVCGVVCGWGEGGVVDVLKRGQLREAEIMRELGEYGPWMRMFQSARRWVG